MWAEKAIDHLRLAEPEIIQELNDRQFDVREPLLTITALIDGDWPKRLRKALLESTTHKSMVPMVSHSFS